MGDTLPGAFPEDEASVITTEDVFKPREILIDFKAQREIDRKVKEAGNPKRTFRVTQAEPGALTGKENPRIPPGNHLSRRFQVLDLGHRPAMDMNTWNLTVTSSLGTMKLGLADIRALGEEELVTDVHCVTRWSAFDTKFTGIRFSKIMEHCKSVIPANWGYLLEAGVCGYTTNVPRRDVERSDCILVYGLDGQIPIPIEHGVVRIIFPHLYLWKSAKFLEKITFSEEDVPGFWELKGYHKRANAWAEERYGEPEDEIEQLGPEFEKLPVA